MVEEIEKNIDNKEKHRKNVFWVKLISSSVFILSWLIFIIRKNNNPDLSLKEPLIITIILSVIAIISFFGYSSFTSKNNKINDIPEPMSEEEIHNRLHKIAESKWNHIKINNGIELIDDATINKNYIYAYKINMVLDNESFIAVVNANYRDRPFTILKSNNVTDTLIRKKMNSKSDNPYSEPDFEITTTENALTGTRHTTKRKTYKNKNKKDKPESVA